MTLMRETPKDHGLLLDHDPKGNLRLSVTLAGRSSRKNGRRLQYASGALYNRCVQHASTILWNHHGTRLQPQEEAGRQYHPITEEAAVQIRLLLDAVSRHRNEPTRRNDWPAPSRICTLAKAVGGTPATRTVTVPRKVLDALALMYA